MTIHEPEIRFSLHIALKSSTMQISSELDGINQTLFEADQKKLFYGITIFLTVVYYKHNPNDFWFFQYAVALLWIFDTLHVALTTHTLYFYLFKTSGNYIALFTIVWHLRQLQLLINMLIVTGVQTLAMVHSTFGEISRISKNKEAKRLNLFIGIGLYTIHDIYTLTSFVGISTIRVHDSHPAWRDVFLSAQGQVDGQLHQYIAWPDTLIFVAINFTLPKGSTRARLRRGLPEKNIMFKTKRQSVLLPLSPEAGLIQD
ncbi:uncharacterized protein EV420DRAFT_1480804 [Desarmillaria tabescens]|uniref:Uncharacterized protein n=1 Tax=Armillaria tabescens TaxID=1929756 RepID=A0AA39KAC7_ARMTA|nr:uncharacterized protein EV420DRAFT_1480804 [Desarmillaria tabescens]KAK0457332.1 hypothetical protein EV420DRAFT_1480804 [Desarmillaria tabescens]